MSRQRLSRAFMTNPAPRRRTKAELVLSSGASGATIHRLTDVQKSLPVADRPRRPEWMKVRAPSADSRYFDVKKLIHGAEPAHDLRGGPLPEHRRVLGPRHGDVPDPRRHVHARVPLLLRHTRASPSTRPTRSSRCGSRTTAAQMEPQARRRHLGRPRRRRPTGAPATTRRRSAR
mgnify:CR=1 FL=1